MAIRTTAEADKAEAEIEAKLRRLRKRRRELEAELSAVRAARHRLLFVDKIGEIVSVNGVIGSKLNGQRMTLLAVRRTRCDVRLENGEKWTIPIGHLDNGNRVCF